MRRLCGFVGVLFLLNCGTSASPPPPPPAATVEGVVQGEDGAPLANVALTLAIGSETVSATSGADGAYALGLSEAQLAALPPRFFVVATGPGYGVGALELPKPEEGPLAGHALRVSTVPLHASAPLVLPKSGEGRTLLPLATKTTHLGNGDYSGSENSQFQLPNASGTVAALTLRLPAGFDAKGARSLKVEIFARGIQQGARLRFAGSTYAFDDSPADGSAAKIAIDLPVEALVAGDNALAVASAEDVDEVDDFEYAYAQASIETFTRPICTTGPVVEAKNVAPPDPNAGFTDPDVAKQTTLAAIGAKEAWGYFFHPQTGIKKTVLVALPDTGVIANHEDLAEAIWTNPAPDTFSRLDGSLCHNDVHGYNFVTGTSDVTPLPQTIDDCRFLLDHGTFIAGILAARSANKKGIASAAGNVVSLLPLNIVGTCKDHVPVSEADFEDALRYATHFGARVINVSTVAVTDPGEVDATFVERNGGFLEVAIESNAVVTLAAGNAAKEVSDDAWLARVGSIKGAIVVGGTTNDGSLFITKDKNGDPFGSNFGTTVELAAPAAERNYGTGETGVYSTANQLPYGHGEGTSFAAPAVAAAAALAIAFVETRGATLTPAQTECFLEETARIEPKLVGRVQKGRVLSLDRLARQLNAQFPPR